MHPEQWTVALSLKDLVMWALIALNVVAVVVLCTACKPSGMGKKQQKYQAVEVQGDSELEEFKQ